MRVSLTETLSSETKKDLGIRFQGEAICIRIEGECRGMKAVVFIPCSAEMAEKDSQTIEKFANYVLRDIE